jgi:hypothetical protein
LYSCNAAKSCRESQKVATANRLATCTRKGGVAIC